MALVQIDDTTDNERDRVLVNMAIQARDMSEKLFELLDSYDISFSPRIRNFSVKNSLTVAEKDGGSSQMSPEHFTIELKILAEVGRVERMMRAVLDNATAMGQEAVRLREADSAFGFMARKINPEEENSASPPIEGTHYWLLRLVNNGVERKLNSVLQMLAESNGQTNGASGILNFLDPALDQWTSGECYSVKMYY